MPAAVTGKPCLLTVLLGFVVLLTTLEQAIVSEMVVRPDFVRVICRSAHFVGSFPARMSYLCLAGPGLFTMLIGCVIDGTLLVSTIFLVLPHLLLPFIGSL
jgi:hypothetical protein